MHEAPSTALFSGSCSGAAEEGEGGERRMEAGGGGGGGEGEGAGWGGGGGGGGGGAGVGGGSKSRPGLENGRGDLHGAWLLAGGWRLGLTGCS